MVLNRTENYKTLVLGASDKRGRFSYLAIKSLVKHNVEVYAIGARAGQVDGITISTDKIDLANLHTVTLYLNPANQKSYIDYMLNLKPKRIIFNPGTENPELLKKARENGIEVVFDCTLVMLSNNSFFHG
ncbi:MAG: CoA-binding protein [Bacteroidales bacterium]